MKNYPKQCCNNNCTNVFFIEKYRLHLDLQCQTCIDKRNKTE